MRRTAVLAVVAAINGIAVGVEVRAEDIDRVVVVRAGGVGVRAAQRRFYDKVEVEAEEYGRPHVRHLRAESSGPLMAPHLTAWTADEIKALIRQGLPFWQDQSERKCPACGRVSVRSYMHYSYRPRVISKTWCANCWRFAASTGPEPPVPFTDPFAGAEPGGRKLAFLNEQWDKGVLPQKFG